MQLGHARFVDTDFGANLLHRRFAVVVETDHLLLAGGQRRDCGAHAVPGFLSLVGGIRLLRFRGDEGCRKCRFVDVIVVRQRRGRLNRVDADDGPAKAFFVGPDFRGEVRQGRLVAQLPSQFLTCRFELAALAANATWPGVLPQSVNHRAPDATFSERLELDSARLVETMRGVDEPNDTVLDKISDVDRVGHRGRDTSSELFYERDTGNNARILRNCLGAHECDLRRHVRQPRYQRGESTRIPVQQRDEAACKLL